MNRTSRNLVASLVLAAASLAAASVAEAVPPLPQPRIDAVHADTPGRTGTPHLILAGILDGIAVPLNWNGNGLGYYAPTVRGLGEIIGSERGERRNDRKLAKRVKKSKGQFEEEIEPLVPGELTGVPPELPESPGLMEHPGRRIGDLPTFNEPIDRPFVKKGKGRPDNPPGGHDNPPGRPNGAVEVSEPSGAALLVIGMVGLLLAARPRKTR